MVGPDVTVSTACRDLPAIDVTNGALAGAGAPLETRTVHGIEVQLVERGDDGSEVWSIPTLDATLTSLNGADPTAVIDSVERSARTVARTDVASGAAPDWASDPDGWQTVTFEGVEVHVPADWPRTGHRVGPNAAEAPCEEWARSGPSAVTGVTGNPRCGSGQPWVPRDGLWMLPLSSTQIEVTPDLDRTLTIGSTEVTEIWDVRLDVLEIVVPGRDGRPDVLVRIGLGVDGHTAGSILSSIRVTGAPSDTAITLPCDLTVVSDRRTLDLPEDLNVGVLQGLGGTAGSQSGPGQLPCAVNLTAVFDPGRHISFVRSGLGGDAAKRIDGVRDVRWGKIHDGYGAELKAEGSDEAISVLAYGLSEAEAERLFRSLASS
jgi:hypothetical protein